MLKPREKLAIQGPSELEDHELFSIMLGKGNKKENVFEQAKRILKGFDHEELIHLKNIEQFQKNFKVGFVQACTLMAAFEIGRRFFAKNIPAIVLRTADQVFEHAKNMKYLKKEYVRGLYLNTRYRLIHDEIITIGSLDANIVHPREIFRPAIEYGAYCVILTHNHPSQDPTPSEQDIEITQQLRKVGNLLQIPLLDHLIIGDGYTSLKKANLML